MAFCRLPALAGLLLLVLLAMPAGAQDPDTPQSPPVPQQTATNPQFQQQEPAQLEHSPQLDQQQQLQQDPAAGLHRTGDMTAAAAGTPGPQQLQQQPQQPQQLPQQQPQSAQVVMREECADVPISTSQLALASMAEIIVTGVVLAAGAGTGQCHPNGTLTPLPDDPPTATAVAASQPAPRTPSNSSYMLIGLQCVHKGLVRCRNNTDDLGDCLLLLEAPVLPDSAPCALTGGQRYMFFLQSDPGPCDGYYFAMFQRAYHTIRRPLGGTGCTFYPAFPDADDMVKQINGQCDSSEAASCSLDRCDPRVTRSPCANDTAARCDMKLCAGKFMYYNAIMPSETCYELYSYRTSGLPVNCYGQRYINNRIREIELQQALANATARAAEARSGQGALQTETEDSRGD